LRLVVQIFIKYSEALEDGRRAEAGIVDNLAVTTNPRQARRHVAEREIAELPACWRRKNRGGGDGR